MIYLDASVLMPLQVTEPGSATVDRFIAQEADDLLVSEFAAGEFASALSRMVRMKQLDPDDAMNRLADFDVWRADTTNDVDLLAADFRVASLFVRRFGLMLRMPDALHAAICSRTGAVLATMDVRLAHAAGALGLSVHLIRAP